MRHKTIVRIRLLDIVCRGLCRQRCAEQARRPVISQSRIGHDREAVTCMLPGETEPSLAGAGAGEGADDGKLAALGHLCAPGRSCGHWPRGSPRVHGDLHRLVLLQLAGDDVEDRRERRPHRRGLAVDLEAGGHHAAEDLGTLVHGHVGPHARVPATHLRQQAHEHRLPGDSRVGVLRLGAHAVEQHPQAEGQGRPRAFDRLHATGRLVGGEPLERVLPAAGLARQRLTEQRRVALAHEDLVGLHRADGALAASEKHLGRLEHAGDDASRLLGLHGRPHLGPRTEPLQKVPMGAVWVDKVLAALELHLRDGQEQAGVHRDALWQDEAHRHPLEHNAPLRMAAAQAEHALLHSVHAALREYGRRVDLHQVQVEAGLSKAGQVH
mmetsp:Transcript_94918/g.245083  ORF Transcript_94918/g.245083 Transcript_94918/m.245083 type:complete len:382 (+) Transcript_94918:61-1206(+)